MMSGNVARLTGILRSYRGKRHTIGQVCLAVNEGET